MDLGDLGAECDILLTLIRYCAQELTTEYGVDVRNVY